MRRRLLAALGLLVLLAVAGCLGTPADDPEEPTSPRALDPDPKPASEHRPLHTETFEDEVPIGVAVEEPGRSASWQASGQLDVPAEADQVLVEIRWSSTERGRQELNLTLCSARCGGPSSDEVAEHVSGPSPLRLQVDRHGDDVHWRVTAASTLVVRQAFVGEAHFSAAPSTVQEPDADPEGTGTMASEVVGAPYQGPQRVAVLGASLALTWLVAALQRAPILGTTLYTRFEPHELLDHPDRARVMEEVRADPGVHFRALKRRLGIGRGILGHHLRLLCQANLLVEHCNAGHRCFHLPGTSTAASRDGLAVLRSERARSLLRAICVEPGVTSADLAEATGLTRATISHHLARLRQADLVASRSEGRRRPLVATELGRWLLEGHG